MILIPILLLLGFSGISADQKHLPDSHAPISVMADHTHKKGEIMFSYRFMNMSMDKLFSNTNKLSPDEAMSLPNGASDSSGTYMNAPLSMSMDMHMFGVMYAPKEEVTFMLMTNYTEKEMTQRRMRMSGNAKFDVNSSGFGDLTFAALFKIPHKQNWKSSFGVGSSFPTGSINLRDNTPNSDSSRLGYSMQNGTGTYDPFLLINNLYILNKFRVGQQLYFKSPASGKNNKGYKYGHNMKVNLWTSYRFIEQLSLSLKLNYDLKTRMKGSDNEMTKRMSPSMDSYNQGYRKLNIGFGLNFVNHQMILNNHRLGFEYLFPLYQNFKGIQMREKYSLIFGWQYSF